jgi:hypothetical protein
MNTRVPFFKGLELFAHAGEGLEAKHDQDPSFFMRSVHNSLLPPKIMCRCIDLASALL